MNRRKMLTISVASAGLLLALSPPLAPSARAAEETAKADERVLGKDDAPITIIEYSSLTCPHCAAFHADTLPQIKADWIEEGKAKLIYRHFPLDALALRAAAVANCIEGDRYFAFLDVLFSNQQRWTRSDDPLAALGKLAALAGVGEERFQTCVGDEAEMNRILKAAQKGREKFGIEATPTIIVNGKKLEGARRYEDFEKIFNEVGG